MISTFKKLVLFLFNQIVSFSKQFFTSSLISFSTFFIILFTFIEFILFATLFATFFATSKKLIFWAKIKSKTIISSKFSRLSLSILEFLKSASISLFSLSSTRFYMTINDLFVMFFEKFKLIDLIRRQKNEFFSYHWQFNKLVIFISHQTRITSYFLSSFNSFKFNILSKSKLCLFIQTSVLRRIFFLRAKYQLRISKIVF